ncbi:glutathione S-transferase [Xinfangfangia sp. CPCC 101601]|uniref:Glutathione S-transferase n=1 Tax=Pseudogemmobacter lacusdianii TaxID=3069608 RepID=A0ABU0VU24_9RHOB|nr:glutathione S-transferase [Xinfangfangia sp. CPCC 101601]MDQ2065231.1 glutathione S-transferase [Xinfangfangia sp. CPCC 101601]
MKLFGSATSPFVRKVMVLIHEAGLTGIEVHDVVVSPVAEGTLPLNANPLGKIPALLLDDGRAIYDSRVICRYLDEHGQAGFYPKGDALWDVLTLEALADGITEAALAMAYEVRLRPEEQRFLPWVEGQWLKIARGLDAIEADAAGQLQGPLNMGHIALGAAFGYLDLRHSARDWRNGRPALAAWEAKVAARPSMLATVPKG